MKNNHSIILLNLRVGSSGSISHNQLLNQTFVHPLPSNQTASSPTSGGGAHYPGAVVRVVPANEHPTLASADAGWHWHPPTARRPAHRPPQRHPRMPHRHRVALLTG